MADSVVIKITGDDSDFRSKMSNLGSIAKKGAAAVGAVFGATAIASVKAYAEYEQLVGGVETLFKSSSSIVLDYANNAFKTAGMSANEYMDTVTGFSASLLQSLGGDTDKAAKKADLAITDMADNANKMGTSMESIQYAYQGFAKQNYTMLDNLKLGYGGTKEEMQRLLEDAEKISGIKYDISSYADVVDAIHVVQTEMGITGTTAKEAGDTIQGSMKAAKSAFENFLTGMADEDADMGKLVDNLVNTVITALKNIVPRIVETIPRLIEGFGKVFDELVGYLPESIQKVIEVFKKIIPVIGVAVAAMYAWKAGLMISGVISAVSKSISIMSGIMTMYANGAKISTVMTTGFTTAQKVMGTVVALATGKIKLAEVAQWAWNAAMSANPIGLIIIAIVALVAIIVVLWNKCEWFRDLVTTAFEWISSKFAAMWEKIKSIWDTIYPYLVAFWEAVKPTIIAALDAIIALFSAAWAAIKFVWDLVQPYFQALWDGIVLVFSVAIEVFSTIFSKSFAAIKFIWDLVAPYFQAIWRTIEMIFSVVAAVLGGDFGGAVTAIKSWWNDMTGYFSRIWEGIKSVFSGVVDFFRNLFSDAYDTVKEFFTVENFKKIFEESICGGLENAKTAITNKAGEVWTSIKKAFSKVIDLVFGGVSYNDSGGVGGGTAGIGGLAAKGNGINFYKLAGMSGPNVHKSRKAADYPAPRNTPIPSLQTGTITGVQVLSTKDKDPKGSYGRNVTITSGGKKYVYAHMNKFATRARVGQRVARGQVIGYVGASGNTKGKTGLHLHYGIRGFKLGGFPSMGEIFQANEDGIEMMGRMGKKNVIANNMQIIEGIKQGLFSGMANYARAKGASVGKVTNITQEMHFHKENESPSDIKRAARKGVKLGLAGGKL